MRTSLIGFALRSSRACIFTGAKGQLISGQTLLVNKPTSWLSSTSSGGGGGSGASKKGSQGRNNSNNNNNNEGNNNTNKKLGGGPKSTTLKRMADAVREKTIGLKPDGDKVSSDRVKHDKSSRRFTLDLGNNRLARIDYRSIGPDKIEMYHSEVPEELRGKGLGKALAKGALEQAARENMRVKVKCSYLIDFVNKTTDPKLKKNLV